MNSNDGFNISYYKIHSEVLEKEMAFSVCEPDFCERKTPLNTLFFLHGRTGNETFLESLNIASALSELIRAENAAPIRMICPCLDNSRGINSAEKYQVVEGKHSPVYKGRYEDYFISELLPYIKEHFPMGECFIGGVSAGGYTALSLGLRNTSLFSKIGGHMPAIDLKFEDEDECYFSDKAMWLTYDPITLAQTADVSAIRFYIDDGLQDEGKFYNACKKLNDILLQKSAKVELHLSDGHHNSEYIMKHLKDYLKFYTDL